MKNLFLIFLFASKRNLIFLYEFVKMSNWNFMEFHQLYSAKEHRFKSKELNLRYPNILQEEDFYFNDVSTFKEIVLVPQNEHILKRLQRIYCQSGWSGVLEDIQSPKILAKYPKLQIIINATKKLINFFNNLKILFGLLPKSEVYIEQQIIKYIETRNWFKGNAFRIRLICWHPNNNQLALVCCDDSIRIFYEKAADPIILKNISQRWISCIAWRTCTTSELIVGCQSGLCHWVSDEIKCKLFLMNFYTQPNHAPITSLQWNRDGTFLITASINDSNIIIWNIDEVSTTILQRIGLKCHLIKWSPDESLLFGATVGKKFFIWATDKNWKIEHWTVHSGYVQSICWSPCSLFALFITSEESNLYLLLNSKTSIIQRNDSVMVEKKTIVDLSKLMFCNESVGGKKPFSLCWDQTGCYLAVIFKDIRDVIIFNTKILSHELELTPNCIISGSDVEYPTCIAFQSMHSTNRNVVLTINWCTSRLQYFSLCAEFEGELKI